MKIKFEKKIVKRRISYSLQIDWQTIYGENVKGCVLNNYQNLNLYKSLNEKYCPKFKVDPWNENCFTSETFSLLVDQSLEI